LYLFGNLCMGLQKHLPKGAQNLIYARPDSSHRDGFAKGYHFIL